MCEHIDKKTRKCFKCDYIECAFVNYDETINNGSEHCGLLFYKDKRFPKLPKKPKVYEYNYYC